MSLPFGNLDPTFERFLQELPEDYREWAMAFKAFTRSRKIKTPEQVMQVVMSYCGIDAVWRETAGNCTLLEERLSDTAIHQRRKACVPWGKAVLSRMMREAAQPLLEGHLRFLVVEGSTVPGPGATGTEHRLHLALDPVRWQFGHVVVTDEHPGEHLRHYPLQNGEVVVERGYNQVDRWMDQADRGVGLVVRDNAHGVNLYDARGQQLALERLLKETTATELCLPVQGRTTQKTFRDGHRHACRLPPAPAAEARRRVRAEANKQGRQLPHRTLALAEWVLIFTTWPPTVLPPAPIRARYRVRWPVELAIKRLQSILTIDQLRARKNSVLADLYLHGKLLYAGVVEKRARRRCGQDWNRLDQPRRAPPWRIWQRLHRELTSAITGARQWTLSRWAEALDVLQERPRRRQLQTVPDRVRRLIANCQAQGLSNI